MARIKNQFEFISGMHIAGETYFNRYALTIDFYTVDSSPEDQNTALDRIAYFLYDAVARSTFIQEDETKQIDAFTKAGMPVLTVPGPGPFDPVVLAVLVTKMNTIMEDVLVISEAEMISEVSGPLVYIWDSADDDDEVHKLVNDEDETRWWASADPRFGSYPEGVDVVEVEITQPFPLTWEMLNLSWKGDTDAEGFEYIVASTAKTTGKKGTVIKADFNAGDKKKPIKPKK